MHSQPITNMLNTIQKCSRSPNKKDEVIVKDESPPPHEDHDRKRKRKLRLTIEYASSIFTRVQSIQTTKSEHVGTSHLS
jgi:hypothetical protein